MGLKEKDGYQARGWACVEFGEVDLGDQRLKTRLVKLADRLAALPESSINQACNDWAETKAAYRFFQNESVHEENILASHVGKTVTRARTCQTILAIQDTCYFSYTKHKKTTGLGVICEKPGANVKTLATLGVIMHTSFAVTTEGLPLGILDQKVFARQAMPEELKKKMKRGNNANVAIEDKESFRWLESLKKTHNAVADALQVVTICDREGDMYEFFECAHKTGTSVLVRGNHDRTINKIYRHGESSNDQLWSFVQRLPSQGTIEVKIPARDQKPARIATLQLRFGSFTLNPPRNHMRRKAKDLPDLRLNAILVQEERPPKEEEALEWMLLTDLPIAGFEEAVEKVRWYCLRWRIEVFHKILKSGLRVEQCRLQTADRLIRYLTVMSIIAWRIYWTTLIARADPQLPCTPLLAEEEWRVLYSKIHKTKSYPKEPPRIHEVVRWIAMLGGFLGRKSDGEPGVITLWRGWKRLCDLSEGWNLARA